MDFVRSRALIQHQYSKLPINEQRLLAATGQKPCNKNTTADKEKDEVSSGSEKDDNDDDSVEIMESCSTPPANWEPKESMPDEFIPEGWPCYFALLVPSQGVNTGLSEQKRMPRTGLLG